MGKNYLQKTVEVMGTPINVPVIYRDTSALMAFFSISQKEAKILLNSNRLKPVKISYERCLLGITIFNYTNCPVGPYRELALSIPAMIDTKIVIPILPLLFDTFFKNYGFYTILLGMNTEMAQKHSEQIFGYPTFKNKLTIEIQEDEHLISIDVLDNQKKVLKLSTSSPVHFKKIKKNFNTFYKTADELLLTKLHTEAEEGVGVRDKNQKLLLGNHEISDLLKRLKIDINPIKVLEYKNALEILEEPIKMGSI